jgi:hypothetical protein
MTTYGRSEGLTAKEFGMARTPEEVFQHHAEALGAGDLNEIVADYCRRSATRYSARSEPAVRSRPMT